MSVLWMLAWRLRESGDAGRRMVLMALWGNQGDSSLFTVADLQGKGEAEAKAEGMLVDEAQDVYNWLDARSLSTSSLPLSFSPCLC
eukprot:1896806-Rhodomonas_salina.1